MNQKNGSPITNVVHSKCEDQKRALFLVERLEILLRLLECKVQTDVDQTQINTAQIPTNQMLSTDWGREIRSHCLVRTCNQVEKFYYLLVTNTR